MSIDSHTKRLVAVQIWVLRIASEVISFAANGDPPLKPVQPTHRKPAPPNMWIMLFGGKCCLSCESLGPTYSHPRHHKIPQSIHQFNHAHTITSSTHCLTTHTHKKPKTKTLISFFLPNKPLWNQPPRTKDEWHNHPRNLWYGFEEAHCPKC